MPDSLEDAIFGIVNDTAPTPGQEEGAEVVETPVEGAEQPAGEETPVLSTTPSQEEASNEPPPAEEQVAEGEFDEQVGPPRVTEKEGGAKEWHWPEERAKAIYSGYKDAQAFREIAATPEEAKKMAEDSLDLQMMRQHFASGDPRLVDNFLTHWSRRSPDGVAILASRLVERSRSENPKAYEAIGNTVLRDFAEHNYREYARVQDKNSPEAQKLLFVAQFTDWFLGNEVRQGDHVKPLDPTSERLKEIEQREQRLRQEDLSRQEQAWNEWRGQTDQDIRREVQGLIEQALKPIENLKKEKPFLYTAAQKEIAEKVRATVGGDRLFQQNFGLRYEAARRSRTEEDRKQLVSAYKGRVQRAVNQVAAKVVTEASSAFVKASQETHQQKAAASQKTEISPGGPSKSPTLTNPRYQKARDEKDVVGMFKELVG